MIEQFLQTSLEFLKEIWFQLNSQFGLEDTEAFKFIKPYLLQLQDNPIYMGISLAALFLVPYGLIKIRSISKKREQKLDELMEEMEDEYDDDDPRRLRRPEPELDDDAERPLFTTDTPGENEDETTIIAEDDIEEEDLESEFEEFELDSDRDEADVLEEKTEPISTLLSESEFDKDLNEFMGEEQGITAKLSNDDSAHDEAIKQLQEEGELMELDEKLPSDDPFANYSELDDDEQDRAIKELQDEMERTINQLAQQIDEPNEVPNSIKDLSEIHIGGDSTIDDDYDAPEEYFLEEATEDSPKTESMDIQSEGASLPEEPSPVSELSDSEILASLEAETTEVPDTHDYVDVSESFTFEPDASSTEHDYEHEVTSERFTFEPEPSEPEGIPEYNNGRSPLSTEPEAEYSSPEKSDNLIDRLKFLQTRFENRYQPTEPKSTPVKKKPLVDYGTESLTEPRRYPSSSEVVPPDSKKYMDLLESFIFMKDQKRHK